jgi:ligand-binding SRPBCC domain-containing protein
MTRHYTLKREQWLDCPLDEIFDFFSNAGNLEHLTPPWLKFKILATPLRMEEGTKIQYRIGWHGLPLRWTTEILRWKPPHEFVDLQLSGPYKLWHHTHRFQAERGGTRITDIVQYALPLGPLGWIAHALWVKKDVEKIFDYRQARIEEMFGKVKPAA